MHGTYSVVILQASMILTQIVIQGVPPKRTPLKLQTRRNVDDHYPKPRSYWKIKVEREKGCLDVAIGTIRSNRVLLTIRDRHGSRLRAIAPRTVNTRH